ncbi:hypothetical protein GGR77_003214 [Xanthomonas translucens]
MVLHDVIGLRCGRRCVRHRGRLHVCIAWHRMAGVCRVLHLHVLHAAAVRRRTGRNIGDVGGVPHRRAIGGRRRWRGVQMRRVVGRRTHACRGRGCRRGCSGNGDIRIGNFRRMHVLRTRDVVREQ